MNKQYYKLILVGFFCLSFLTGCASNTKTNNQIKNEEVSKNSSYPKLMGCVGLLTDAYESKDKKRLNTVSKICDAQVDKEYAILITTDGNVELVKNDIQHVIRGIRQTTKSSIIGYGFIKDFKLLNDHPQILYVRDIAKPAPPELP